MAIFFVSPEASCSLSSTLLRHQRLGAPCLMGPLTLTLTHSWLECRCSAKPSELSLTGLSTLGNMFALGRAMKHWAGSAPRSAPSKPKASTTFPGRVWDDVSSDPALGASVRQEDAGFLFAEVGGRWEYRGKAGLEGAGEESDISSSSCELDTG